MAASGPGRPVECVRLEDSDLLQRQVLVVTKSSMLDSNGHQLLDVQLSSRDEKAIGQRGLHLAKRMLAYSDERWNEITQAARGPDALALPDAPEVYAVIADLMPTRHVGEFTIRNIGPSPERVDNQVLARQRQSEDLARLIDLMITERSRSHVGSQRTVDDSDSGGIEFGVAGHGSRPGEILRSERP